MSRVSGEWKSEHKSRLAASASAQSIRLKLEPKLCRPMPPRCEKTKQSLMNINTVPKTSKAQVEELTAHFRIANGTSVSEWTQQRHPYETPHARYGDARSSKHPADVVAHFSKPKHAAACLSSRAYPSSALELATTLFSSVGSKKPN
jgi:hypothetical protein